MTEKAAKLPARTAAQPARSAAEVPSTTCRNPWTDVSLRILDTSERSNMVLAKASTWCDVLKGAF